MSGLFDGRIAFASVGYDDTDLPDLPWIIAQQSGDFAGIVSVESPDAFKIVFTLALATPIAPTEAIYIATARSKPGASGLRTGACINMEATTDTTVSVSFFTTPEPEPVMALAAASPLIAEGFDLVILVKPKV